MIRVILSKNADQIENFILGITSNSENKNKILHKCVDFQKKHPVQFSNFIRQIFLARSSHFSQKPKANVLVLSSQNDRLVNFNCSQKIADMWNCSNHIHPTAGHDLPLDDAQWMIEKLKAQFKY